MGQIQDGATVYGSDGEKIGNVSEIGPNYVVVSKGIFFPKDIYIPESAITDTADDGLTVDATKDSIEGMGWDAAPEAAPDTASAYERETAATGQTDVRASDGERIELREEQLQAGTRPVQTGEVRLSKDVVEEEQSIDVPVHHEEVEIQRTRVDRPADSADAFSEQQVSVPVMAEEVEITKEPRVVEEVAVGKTAHQETQQVSEPVRREELDVEHEGDIAPASDRTRE